MRRTLNAAVLILALGGVLGLAAQARTAMGAQLPATPQLPSFGKGLFAPRSTARTTADKPAAPLATPSDQPLPARPTLLSAPASTFAGREATLQALQDCYARGAVRVRAAGSPETRVRRLRQLCDNEEIADTRAWLKWSKIGDGRQSRKIVNAIQNDDAEKALAAAAAP